MPAVERKLLKLLFEYGAHGMVNREGPMIQAFCRRQLAINALVGRLGFG